MQVVTSEKTEIEEIDEEINAMMASIKKRGNTLQNNGDIDFKRKLDELLDRRLELMKDES